tara:strand:- start:6492 stop:6803 length:312 start_codon:yes stop_codon:yes gene_type:complete
MEDFKKLAIKLMKHETFDGMAKSNIEAYCGICNGWLGRIMKGEVEATWATCRKLAEASGVALHVVASDMSKEEAAKRRKNFVSKRSKIISANASKQKKSLIKG